MSIQDFITYLKSVGITENIYPLSFPSSAPKDCMILEVGQGFSSRGSVNELTLTITARSNHPKKAEELAQRVNTLLKDRTNEQVGQGNIILIKSQQLIPNYLGKDSEGNYYYMNNFRVLVDTEALF